MDEYGRYLYLLKNMDLKSDDFASQLYTRKELEIDVHHLPYNIKIKVEDSEWDCKVTKDENKLEFKFDRGGCSIIAAIHPNLPEQMFLFSCETSDHVTICNHDSICEEDKGFINHAGFIKIDIQIQKIVKHPTSLSFLERKLLLQLFWEYGASINKEFKKLFEDTARDISTEILTFDEWLKYTKVKDFSISEGTLVKEALVYFDGDIVLLDILYMGYNSIRKNDIPTGLPRLVEAKGKNFHLLSPASKTLRLASDQIYSPINLKKDESFNHEVVISLENNLKKIGCLAFQMYFIKSQFRKNFDEFKMNLRNKSEAVKKKPKNSKKGVKIAEKQPSTSEELKPDLPLPSTEEVEYEKYVKTLDDLFSKATKRFSIIADELKKDVDDLLSKHPKNELFAVLRNTVSEKYIAAHTKIFNGYKPEESELDYEYYYGKDNWHGGTKHGTKSKKEAIETGLEGEKYASEYFSRSYGDTATVTWMNEIKESGLPYDLLVKNNEGTIINYIEVKSTSLDKKGFYISNAEYAFANKKKDLYTVAHVHIDEREKKNEKRYKVDEYKDPANGKSLRLFLKRL